MQDGTVRRAEKGSMIISTAKCRRSGDAYESQLDPV